MNRVDALPSDVPVLISKLDLGHRVVADGKPACHTEAVCVLKSVREARAFHVGICPVCWKGDKPW